MIVMQEKATFQPVTLVFETELEFQHLLSLIEDASDNSPTYSSADKAAKWFKEQLKGVDFK
jgi:hypothetical protein